MEMKKIFLVILSTTLLLLEGFSQSVVNFKVLGLVGHDQATVSLGSQSYLTGKRVQNGENSFNNIQPGEYFLKIEANGYNSPNSKKIIINGDGTISPVTELSLVVTKMQDDSTKWIYNWRDDVSNSGSTTISHINNPPTIEFLGQQIVPADQPLAGSLSNDYKIVLSNGEEEWTQEYTFRLLETLKTIPYFSTKNEISTSKFLLTNDYLFEDISIQKVGGVQIIRISKECFTYANPFLVNLDGVRGRFYSKRLHHALVNFATDFGRDISKVNKILVNRYGCTTNIPSYTSLTSNTTHEDAGRFQQFKPEELVSIINIFEEMPEGFHKISHLNYLVRRQNGHMHPTFPGSYAVAWPIDNGYIEFMESAFQGDANSLETLRLIIHEKTHFLWNFTFSEDIKNEWKVTGGWFVDPNSNSGWSTTKTTEFVSATAHGINPSEDMAESVADYLKNPELLQSRSIQKYEFIRDRIMHGTRYISKIPDHLTFEVLNLYPDYDYPGKIKRLDINVSGSKNADKLVTVEIELNHINGFQDAASQAYTRVYSPTFIDVDGISRNQFVDIQLYPVNGNGYVLRGSVKISKFSKRGYWTAGDIGVKDLNGNQRLEGRNDVAWNMFVDNSLEDVESPKFKKGSLEYVVTDTIVSGHSAKNLRILYGITDNKNISSVYCAVNGNKAAHTLEHYGKYNVQNQKAFFDVLITEYQPSSEFWVASAIFADSARNETRVYFSNSPRDETIEKVKITSINPDSIAPEVDLSRITIVAEPTHPEAPDGETLVKINLFIKDNKSGLGGVSYRLRDSQGVDHFNYFYHRNSSNTYFQGDPTVWEKYTITCILPRGSVPGIWGLSELSLSDKVWNNRIYNMVETLIFEPDNSTSNYELFSNIIENDTVNIMVSKLETEDCDYQYRVVNEETGEEVKGNHSSSHQPNGWAHGRTTRSAIAPVQSSESVDISSLSAGKLLVIVEVNDSLGNVISVKSASLYKKEEQQIVVGDFANINYGDNPLMLPTTSDKGLIVNYQSSNNQIAKVNGNIVTILGAGEVDIIASQNGNATTLAASKLVKHLVINKSLLEISAENKERSVGESNPEFTLKYNGFRNGDSSSVLDILPSIFCTANESSTAGIYEIELNGGFDNNYIYKLINGSLEVLLPTSLQDETHFEVSIYPNPIKESLHIECEEGSKIGIFNESGVCVLNSEFTSKYNVVNVGDWPSGIYLVKILYKGKLVCTKKLLK